MYYHIYRWEGGGEEEVISWLLEDIFQSSVLLNSFPLPRVVIHLKKNKWVPVSITPTTCLYCMQQMWLELRWEQEKPQEKPSMRIRIHFIGSPLDPNPHEPLNIKFFRHATTSYFFYTFLVTYLLSILPTFLNARFLNKLLIP